jgi:hypothetical protein
VWTNRKFWLDSSWRAFRTFCQTLAALLAAQFTGLLQATGQASGGIPHTPWLGFLYASAIAGLISLLQSVDRERAVGASVSVPQDNLPTNSLPTNNFDPSAADYQP